MLAAVLVVTKLHEGDGFHEWLPVLAGFQIPEIDLLVAERTLLGVLQGQVIRHSAYSFTKGHGTDSSLMQRAAALLLIALTLDTSLRSLGPSLLADQVVHRCISGTGLTHLFHHPEESHQRRAGAAAERQVEPGEGGEEGSRRRGGIKETVARLAVLVQWILNWSPLNRHATEIESDWFLSKS